MRSTLSIILALALCVAACDPAAQDVGVRTTFEDGVEFVTASGPDKIDSIWQAFRFGTVEGPPDLRFDRILDIGFDVDGSIWVVDSNPGVRRYSDEGVLLGSVGARGGGPGETQEGFGRVYPGRSGILVLAYDPNLVLFDADGEFVAGRRPILRTGRSYFPVGEAENGWFSYIRTVPQEIGASRGSWIIGRFSIDGEAIDTLVTLPGTMWVREEGRRSASGGSFFDGQPSIDVGPPGSLYYSDPVDYRISVYDNGGRLERVLTRETPRTPIPDGLEGRMRSGVESALRAMREGNPGPRDEINRMTAKAIPAMNHPHVPFIEAIFVSSDGYVWVLRADRHPDLAMRAVAASFGYVRTSWLEDWQAPQVFDRFSPRGEYLGSVELPSEFVPMDVTSDVIVGSIRDEFDVQYVTGFRVTSLNQ